MPPSNSLTCFETVPKLQRNLPALLLPFLLSYLGAYRPTSVHTTSMRPYCHKVFAVSTSVFYHAYIHRSMRPYTPTYIHTYLLAYLPYMHTYICRYIAISIDLYINQVAIHIEMRLKSRNAHSISWRRGHPGSGCLRNRYAQDLRQCDLCITECLLHVFAFFVSILLEVRKAMSYDIL